MYRSDGLTIMEDEMPEEIWFGGIPFHEGLCAVGDETGWYHITDSNRQPAYNERFTAILGPFTCGIAPVSKDGRYYHIRPDGTPAYRERYLGVQSRVVMGLTAVRDEQGYVLIDTEGHQKTPHFTIVEYQSGASWTAYQEGRPEEMRGDFFRLFKVIDGSIAIAWWDRENREQVYPSPR